VATHAEHGERCSKEGDSVLKGTVRCDVMKIACTIKNQNLIFPVYNFFIQGLYH
jgi:hypothetical protein